MSNKKSSRNGVSVVYLNLLKASPSVQDLPSDPISTHKTKQRTIYYSFTIAAIMSTLGNVLGREGKNVTEARAQLSVCPIGHLKAFK